MTNNFLYQQLDATETVMGDNIYAHLPDYIISNINSKFAIRKYQEKAFKRFIYYLEKWPEKKKILPVHLLFNMATGSGKTLMMAGLILYLYEKGYKNFLFFVDSSNIVEKTKDNFLNGASSKYLFNEKIISGGREIFINEVKNFNEANDTDINIFFTTIQGLHKNLTELIKENSITYADFEDKKIVLLSDEAHHINVATKNKTEKEKENNWEDTIKEILNQSEDNVLIEFTATIDLLNKDIHNKYKDKIIYKYDLINFRKDKFSKEIKTLSLDSSIKQVILHSVLLSQYRLKIAEKNGIFLKPVILFKAQKTIAQSTKNEHNFRSLIDNITIDDLEKTFAINYEPTESNILVSVFSYLDKIYNSNLQLLIDELKDDFSPCKTLNVNDEKEKEQNQILLNSLEDKNNPIRVIFAVNKLNEGWDVLNLFDIVRLYDVRDGDWKKDGKYKAGKTTSSEAQLIGRGARYYPFRINEEQDLFTRKYDQHPDDECAILETLHYHSKYDSKYLTELEQALIDEGLKDPKENNLQTVKIKINNKEFYEKAIIYKNKQIINDNKNKNSFADYEIQNSFDSSVTTDNIKENLVFKDKKNNYRPDNKKILERIKISEIDKKIIFKAFNQQKDFWNFANLKKFFGNLETIDDLLKDKFLGGVSIEFSKSKEQLISADNFLEILNEQLPKISKQIKNKASNKKGTDVFYRYKFNKIFKQEKELSFNPENKLFKKIELTAQIRDFFIYDKLLGSTEEENFINFFAGYIKQLQKEYTDIKLVRNDRELKLYRFSDGEGFEPDFILFLSNKKEKDISYQVFIEPKGTHLLKFDEEKEKFLMEIEGKYKLDKLHEEEGNFKLLGLRFYNKEKRERTFEENFKEKLL